MTTPKHEKGDSQKPNSKKMGETVEHQSETAEPQSESVEQGAEGRYADSESEWVPGADGIVERTASRVVLIDPEGKLFLIRGHDIEDPEHGWWFTVGGGIGAEEDPSDGAVRELFEETGLDVEPSRLVGPVLERTALFHFTYRTRRQYEKFFLLYVSGDEAEAVSSWNQDNLTDLERDVLDEVAWWDPADIIQADREGTKIYPLGIGQMASSWYPEWDGKVLTVSES
ncbi:NUDIX hydrolase [Flaviflexus massiliensis]|uniref:NUDIX hydrolase n=1 Tax=Flaviflexus massiliensis TaxID=1522309 RepID=UPI0006D55077|nr:NUDIX domain-containing protein [Flaviflexus massiliensis]